MQIILIKKLFTFIKIYGNVFKMTDAVMRNSKYTSFLQRVHGDENA